MRRSLLLAFLLLPSLVFAQYPEVDAAVEALMAKNLKSVAKYLPPSLQQGIAELSDSDQKELEYYAVISRALLRERIIVRRSDQPDALVVAYRAWGEGSDPPFAAVVLDKRISDGADCLLQFKIQTGERSETFQVWMKFADSRWRIYEIEDPIYGRHVNLGDEKFIERFKNRYQNANQSAVISSLRTYNTALVTYASAYPDIGWPERMEELGPEQGEEECDAHHAGLVDETMSNPPFEKYGYRFHYTKNGDHYVVTARPLKFGITGNRNFYTDESGVIRATDQDQEASQGDSPTE